MTRRIFILFAAVTLLSSCKGTWLMYDQAQTPKLYFSGTYKVLTADFSLIVEDEITVSDTIRLMGTPADVDRSFEMECIAPPEGSTFVTGNKTLTTVAAVEGSDFILGSLVIPAGAVKAPFTVTLKRTPAMLDQAVCVWVRVKDNANFAACPADSASSNIITPDFRVYVSDGEPACPSWWKWNGDKYPLGWHPYLGIYYPDKYRRMLSYLRAAEELSPSFYQTYTANWGLNLENAPIMFWNKCYTNAWARYVAVPLYNYYWNYYKEHPDDPHNEEMTYANIPACVGWGNPSEGTYGILN